MQTTQAALTDLTLLNYVNGIVIDLDHSPIEKFRRKLIVKY